MSDYIRETKLPGVLILEPPVHGDSRGFFRELYRQEDLRRLFGVNFQPVQPNHARSSEGALRGLHIAPFNKLATVMRGLVQQIVVDFREDSPTFGQHISFEMGEDNFRSVFIPAGCGNGVLALSNLVDYSYLFDGYWAVGLEREVLYSDPDIGIKWQTASPLVSKKDAENPRAREVFPDKFT